MQRTCAWGGGGVEGQRGRKSRFPKALALLRKMTLKPGGPLSYHFPPKIQAPEPQMVFSHRPGEETLFTYTNRKMGTETPGQHP